MKYRIDPKTGNKLSILSFGCMRFPRSMGSIDMKKTEELIKKAYAQGINYFDTAYLYPGSEEALGEILSKNNLRDKVYIATKLPIFYCHDRKDFDKYFEKQLKKLKTEYIDYYLMHMITDMASWEKLRKLGIEDWIKDKKEKGQIKQIGFSFHGARDEFVKVLDSFDWDFCMIQYNYSNINYQAGVTGLKKASEKGIPVFIMEPLLGGKLTEQGLPQKALNIFQEADSRFSPASWGFRWLWNQPEVASVLSGMNNESQLEENIRIAEMSDVNMLTKVEEDTYDQVRAVFNEIYKIPCTGCNYCMPCPQNVNIPVCFTNYNNSFMIGRIPSMKQYINGTGAISTDQSNASLCIKCGKCEKHCPQNIKIMDSLDDVSKRMEPFWFQFGLSVARRFLKVNRKNP